MDREKVGAVLISGAGIGGMECALDLAASGFKVYLLDKAPGIGGTMAKLDKTFPTNDCAMCVMSPKLVECGRHPNIEIITQAEIASITGEPGNFLVDIQIHPRFVDVKKCTACGECSSVCPVEIPNEFDGLLGTKKAIHKYYPQSLPPAFTIMKGLKPPCVHSCPAGINVQGYVALCAKGKFKEALSLIEESAILPGILGRLCHHPCETVCNRAEIDEPVAICALKRFIADKNKIDGNDTISVLKPSRKEKVAIVGAGPAGLSCAETLLKMGYQVTIFEKENIPGGMITSCIPEYRIPQNIALYEIDRVLKKGIECKFGIRIGQDISLEDLKESGYNAAFIATGLVRPKALKIEGIESESVHYGIPFLQAAKSSRNVKGFGKKVIVIGGGNVAIDCAKSALRLGAEEVQLVCLETRDMESKDRMPAHLWEIEEAEEEGVIIHPRLGPKRILTKEGRVIGLEVVECVSVFDEDGRFSPRYQENNRTVIIGDTIIIAIGQEPDARGFEELADKNGRIGVNPETLQTRIGWIFAGGDVVRGPSSVIEAIADGKKAASSIDRFLRGLPLTDEISLKDEKLATKPGWDVVKRRREPIKKEQPATRRMNWNEIDQGFENVDSAMAEAMRCLNCGICSQCFECVKVCEAKAIDHNMKESHIQLKVGSIVFGPGFELFNGKARGEYGIGLYRNVITNLQLERLLSAGGPTRGELLRPSDNRRPKRIAFIQCVGSRDLNRGNEYCSSICCMASTKEAIIIKEHYPDTEITIFFLDVRAMGKGFERYFTRALDYGIEYKYGLISRIFEDPKTKNLHLLYSNNGRLKEEDFELVVCAMGLVPPEGMRAVAKSIDLKLNEFGFSNGDGVLPNMSSNRGVFTLGAFNEPKDIPDTVVEAGSTAALVSHFLSPVRGTMEQKKEYPPERPIDGTPRIGVFVCRCGKNIASVVDVSAVVEYARKLPDVIYADENLYTCSQDSLTKIKEVIERYDLNRVVVASCTPLTHGPIFVDTIREAGLNPALFELVSIREHCAWVHARVPEEATLKAKELVAMGVSKVRLARPVKQVSFELNQEVLIIGGGISGVYAALNLAEQGFEVHLIEKEERLGGNARFLYTTIEGLDVQGLLKEMIEKVTDNPLVHIYTNTQLKETSGYVGNFVSKIINKRQETIEIKHGAIIVATGAQEYKPREYLYGQDPRIITQRELEQRLQNHSTNQPFSHLTITMIQCVGSRNEEHPYCSRVCCSQAIKNALKIKELNPQARIFVLYRDIRTYGFYERYYTLARKNGIIFIKFQKEPEVELVQGSLQVRVWDEILRERIVLSPDLLVLSTGIVPENKDLSQILKLPLNSDGFFLEAHAKIKPVEFAQEGIFFCGTAHSPRHLKESIAQALAASIKTIALLNRKRVFSRVEIPRVTRKWCAGCSLCIQVCPYGARQFDEETRTVEVIDVVCQACGACVGVCPNKTSQQQVFETSQILSMIETMAGD